VVVERIIPQVPVPHTPESAVPFRVFKCPPTTCRIGYVLHPSPRFSSRESGRFPSLIFSRCSLFARFFPSTLCPKFLHWEPVFFYYLSQGPNVPFGGQTYWPIPCSTVGFLYFAWPRAPVFYRPTHCISTFAQEYPSLHICNH